MNNDDIYKGKEIDAILRAAARLQEEDHARNDQGLGLSLSEVEEIAAEAGIDPKFVRQAALVTSSEMDDDEDFHFWGGPITLRRNFIVNRALSKQEMEELVPVFQRIKDNGGSTDSLGNSVTWTSSARKDAGSTVIMMQVDGDKTVCRLKSPVMMPGFLIHYIPFILSFMIGLPFAATAGFPPAAFGIAAVLASVLFFITRFAYGKLADLKKRHLHEIEEAIKAVGRNVVVESSTSSITESATGSGLDTTQQEINTETSSGRITLDDSMGPNDGKAQRGGRVRE